MANVAIAVDSMACLTREMVGQYGITVMPLSFYFGGKIYRDWVDISPSHAYELFLKDPESFKTSAISPGQFLEAYREASKQASGEHLLCYCLVQNKRLLYCGSGG